MGGEGNMSKICNSVRPVSAPAQGRAFASPIATRSRSLSPMPVPGVSWGRGGCPYGEEGSYQKICGRSR